MPRKADPAQTVLRYFAEADLVAAQLVLGLAGTIVRGRQPVAAKTRTRTARPAAPAAPDPAKTTVAAPRASRQRKAPVAPPPATAAPPPLPGPQDTVGEG